MKTVMKTPRSRAYLVTIKGVANSQYWFILTYTKGKKDGTWIIHVVNYEVQPKMYTGKFKHGIGRITDEEALDIFFNATRGIVLHKSEIKLKFLSEVQRSPK